MRFVRAYAPTAALIAIAIGVWEGLVRLLHVAAYLFPAPSAIVRAFGDDASLLASATWVTLREVLLGFLIALAAGFLLAVVLHVSTPLRQAFYPLLIASQTVPVVVLAPILVILLGFDIWPKLAIVALICFFPIVVNGVDGLRSVDREYVRMMLTLDASRMSIFRRVEFPSALPAFFTGTRVAATYAAIGAVSENGRGRRRGSVTSCNKRHRISPPRGSSPRSCS